jgi:hypothetical protein
METLGETFLRTAARDPERERLHLNTRAAIFLKELSLVNGSRAERSVRKLKDF